jgi:hypothetical protein
VDPAALVVSTSCVAAPTFTVNVLDVADVRPVETKFNV